MPKYEKIQFEKAQFMPVDSILIKKQAFFLLIALLIVFSNSLSSASLVQNISIEEVQKAFNFEAKRHPRLLITDSELIKIARKIDSRPNWHEFYVALLSKADKIVKLKPVQKKMVGRRMLKVSRVCLYRVVTLSIAYRLSGQQQYLKRAESEMLAASSFDNWNPKHFLDIAEMCAALSIGYDWLYYNLTTDSRIKIKTAIFEKAILPAKKKKYTRWLKVRNNWNQVCNAGITLGALSILEDYPDLAIGLVHRAVNSIQLSMDAYEPNGAYPEGPTYWLYGTNYNCLLLSALSSALDTDFGLGNKPGFSKSAEYFLHATGPTGKFFNYSDSGSYDTFTPLVFWFSFHYDNPGLAWRQHQLWQYYLNTDASKLVKNWFSPLALMWISSKRVKPKHLNWAGYGRNPVAMFRTSWDDPNATFLGIKGGSPRVNHGHMDVGSFVMDSGGVRWVMDLGPENYHKIETNGVKLWGMNQKSPRWRLFRYNNTSHNTLVVNEQHQRVKGSAPIISYSTDSDFPNAVFDISSVYEGQLAKALRGAALLPSGEVIIQDELTALNNATSVRWAVVTPASVELLENDTGALLKQRNLTLSIQAYCNIPVFWRTWSTEPLTNNFEAKNSGTRLIGFKLNLKPGQHVRYTISLKLLNKNENSHTPLKPLEAWGVLKGLEK